MSRAKARQLVERYLHEMPRRGPERGPLLKAGDRRKANADLYKRLGGKSYFPAIPLDDIFAALKANGIVPVQEDNTEWAGIFSGREGHGTIDLAPTASRTPDGTYTPYTNTMLVIDWHKMEMSGNYEVTVYVS